MVICKSPAELEKMHRAGLVVWGALEKMRAMIKPGISTKDLDEFAEAYSEEHHARPAFKGYRGYPGSVCTSINQEVVHGIPSASRKLKEGDILSMDFGVELNGYFGDAALTVRRLLGFALEDEAGDKAIRLEILQKGRQCHPVELARDVEHFGQR